MQPYKLSDVSSATYVFQPREFLKSTTDLVGQLSINPSTLLRYLFKYLDLFIEAFIEGSYFYSLHVIISPI